MKAKGLASDPTYCNDQTNLDAGKDNTEVCAHTHKEVNFVYLPEMDGGFVVDEAKHGSDDNRGKYHKRRVMEQRRQEQ